jgi:antigen flippase
VGAPRPAPGARPAADPAAPAAAPTTYGQILRSSALIGGSRAFTIATQLVRGKIVALLIGPAGVGLVGLYGAVSQLAQSVAAMGISSSGVRQIAAAVGTGDETRIARTAAVLRRTSLALGIAGAALLAALAVPVAVLTFGDGARAPAVALLSVAVLCGVVNGGQGALLQGLRRIGDLARMNALGSFFGAVATVALVAALGERGIVPALVATSAIALACSWWFSRGVHVERPALSAGEVRREATALLQLGFAFLASALLSTGAAYAVRLFILRGHGATAAGLYQAAWAIGGMYVGFLLEAMGSDFYPRLTAAVQDRPECNRLVNEQAHVSLLLAGPGVVATLVLAPLVLRLLYSSAFGGAVDILRWMCVGAALQVITWPIGFIIVAEGRQSLFFWVEAAYAAVYMTLAWILVRWLGPVGAGVAFFGSYVFHGVVLYPIARALTGFRWSAANRRAGLVFLGAIAVAFGASQLLPPWPGAAVGVAAGIAITVSSARDLARLVTPERLPRAVRRAVGWLAPARRG